MHFENENKTITIAGVAVAPGEDKLVKIEIARLPSGTLIDIPVHVFNSKKAGPTVLLQAGLHGDEINGVETLRRMLEQKAFAVKKGAVIVVPILNVFGFIHFSRDVPDGKDVNRSFPGSKSGSLASRIAHNYTQEIMPHIDFGIDLHTGGGQRENYPQVRYTEKDEKSAELAQLFGAPFYFASSLISGSFRKTAFAKGKTILVYEGGESMRFDEPCIQIAQQGIMNVLGALGLVKNTVKKNKKESIPLTERRWVRAPRAGMFIPECTNGSAINKGEVLGKVTDIFAKKSKMVKAPSDGYVFCINRQAVVNQGDALFHIGK